MRAKLSNSFLAVSLLALALFGCGEKQAGDAGVIKLGSVSPLTGPQTHIGKDNENGARLAVEEINAKGLELGGKKVKLELLGEDDQAEPKTATIVAQKLVDAGVVAVIGHLNSGTTIPASKIYHDAGIPQISPSATAVAYTAQGYNTAFRVMANDAQQGKALGQYAVARMGAKKIAIIDDRTAYGQGLADATKAAYEKAGGTSALYEAYTAGEKDYTALVSKLKAEGVGVLYVGGYHTEAGLIVRQMREQGMDTVLVSGDALVTDEYWAITGEAGEGTLMTFSPDPRKNPDAAPLVEKFRAKGIEPEGYVLYTYAAVQAWADAVKAAGSTDFDAVVTALNEGTFKTVLGESTFDEKGDVTLPGYVFYEWKNGTYDYLEN